MDVRLIHRSAVVSLCLVAASAGPIATAQADPPDTGCPTSYTVMAIADLYPQGYRVPSMVDDPNSGLKSFGRPGNGDGLVCAKAIGPQATSWGGQLYDFWDNNKHS
ncbi:MAG: hypothetical protein QOI82_2269 [Actinomycetota bacterium]|jgi:hypothetical protein|nr:hypothetical protein [Actinomycetota bacterium]